MPEHRRNPPILYTNTVGEGPDIVLLHGWGMHSGVWEDVVELLMDSFRVTVMDLPGHGYSREMIPGHDLQNLCHAVSERAPSQAFWVGWSLGGLVAQQAALETPERVRSWRWLPRPLAS